jgi:hypothetical protein
MLSGRFPPLRINCGKIIHCLIQIGQELRVAGGLFHPGQGLLFIQAGYMPMTQQVP